MHRRLIFPTFAVLALTATAAFAASAAHPKAHDDAKGGGAMKAAFSNTIVSTYPDGRVGKLWLSSDGSYRAEGRRHDKSDGHWTLKGGKVCLKQSHPMAVPFTYCTAVPSGGVGTTWSAKAVTGEKISVKLVAGR